MPALDGVEFEVPDGEVVGLVGLNGAGKTTLLRLTAGVAYPTEGAVLVDGLDARKEKRESSRKIGWVPDRPNFDLGARAIVLLEYLAGFYDDLTPSNAKSRCLELLKTVGLEEKKTARLRTYSQGMLKRYAIAAAMLSDPENYLLDEVLNDLDVEGMELVRSWLRQQREKRRAILLSSHNLAELQDLCDRVAVLHKGRLLRVVSHDDLDRIARGLARYVMEIENLDSTGLEYLRSIGEVETGNRQLRLTTKGLAAADIATELVRRGYRLSLIRPESQPLEAYFSQLISEAE
jgi:ABC-2 type transport system ATP-binding protein